MDQGRLELALRASNEGIWDWWTDRREIYYSRRVLEFLECGERHAPNPFLPPHETVHADDRGRFGAAVQWALTPSGPELFAVDCRLRTGGNEWRWLRIRGTVVRNRAGQATRIAGSMIDISRRKAAEEQIEEERHRLRLLIDHVPLQIYFKDRNSRFVLTNQQMAEWMGLSNPDELIGKHDRDFFDSEHALPAAEDERHIMEAGEPLTGKLERETWREAIHGRSTWVLTSKFPWHDRAGRVQGTFGVSSNVTELVEARRKADDLARKLAARNRTYEEELQLAREIQQALSNTDYPEIANQRYRTAFASHYLPITGLAGDFFQIIRIADDSAGILICDVMGHGVRAALVVAMLRGLLEKQAQSAADPSAFLKGLNSGLLSILRRAGVVVFTTAFYAVVDLSAEILRYAVAGHPSGIVSGPDGIRQIATEDSERGPAIGLLEDAEFPPGELPLSEVSRLFLFTDGLIEVESESGATFPESRLMDVVRDHHARPMEEMLSDVLDAALEYSDSHRFEDDVCLLAMEIERND